MRGRQAAVRLRAILAVLAGVLLAAVILIFAAVSCGGPPQAPPRPPRIQRGIDILWYRNPQESAAGIQAQSDRIVAYVQDIGANSIAISFPFYMRDRSASGVFAGSATPSAADLAVLADDAAAHGLGVDLRPLLNQKAVGGWRGAIKPNSRRYWFASYRSFLAPYVAMAAAHRVMGFTVGAELSSLATDPRWRGLDRWIRTVYKGELNFSDNWDSFAGGRLGGDVSLQGLDAYFPVPLRDGATVSELTAALDGWLSRAGDISFPAVLLQEAGIAAQPGAYTHPNTWTRSPARDMQLQANWYRAVCDVERSHHMAGLYFWDIDFNQNIVRPNPVTDPPLSFVGRPGAAAIRACFDALGRG